MLRRIITRGRVLGQLSFAVHDCFRSPFTTATKTAATKHLLRYAATRQPGETDCIHRSRAMMTSTSSTGSNQLSTYLGHSSSCDIDFDLIQSRTTCTKFRDSIWSFVIYRCSQHNQPAWDSLLQSLRRSIQQSLGYYSREEMLQSHDLHVIDDKTLDGATSHQVREHFQAWVPKNLEDRLQPNATDMEDDLSWIYATTTPRYVYCLFVDDICLESVDYPSIDSPVVKLLWKDWESPWPVQERNYTTPAPFHDGGTEYDEEDVGWMYMPVHDYFDKYDLLGTTDWDAQYVRPPYIDYSEDESNMVGHWRQKPSDKEA
ncbi:hypothetical protein F4808DRAFT_470572 [Astrocystis sublimbata]|nr:hypothetical protein F4808DRAFT_470572 [Astrocystis sublimbata]